MKTVLLLVAALLLSSCASTGEIGETKKFTGSFDGYKKVRIQTIPNAALQNDENLRNALAKAVSLELAKIGLFDQVLLESKDGGGATLNLEVKVDRADEPSDVATMFGGLGANAEVAVEANFYEVNPKNPKANRHLSSLSVTGNSKMKARTSVGGIGVTGSGELLGAAVKEAAIRIGKYVQEHSSKKEK